MSVVRTRAIVLRRTNYGEADRILQVITPEGKRSVVARGVRREKSRLAGGIELFAVSDIVIQSGKGDLGVLISARLVTFYRHIMEDYDRMRFGYEAIKQVARASEMVDEVEWYDILAEVLAGLDDFAVPMQLVETWFYLRYAELLGYGLSLYADANGKPLESGLNYIYDDNEKGLREQPGGDITADHIKFLRLINTKPIKVLVQVGGTESILSDCLLAARRHVAI